MRHGRLLALLLAACGATAAEPTPDAGFADAAPDGAPPAMRVEYEGETVRAVHALPGGAALLFREPTGGGLVEQAVVRSLAWIDAAGRLHAESRAAGGELYLDVAAHPSGESTLFLADGDVCRLRRHDAAGRLLAELDVVDTDLVADPTDTQGDPIVPWNVGGCQPHEIRETARLHADGEDVWLVNRGGSSGTVLFRFERTAGGLARALRVPIFPRHGAGLPIGIVASHSVLRSTHWSFVPRLAVDDDGNARVLFVLGGGTIREVWDAFGSPLAEDTVAFVVTHGRDGERLGVREIARTLLRPGASAMEIEAIRWLRGGLVLAGRSAPAPLPDDGFGWDGFLLHLVDGEAEPRVAALVPLDRSDAISDMATHGDGWIVAARSGYWQNPRGASISEEARSEIAVLDADGAVVRRLDLPQGPRHNGALSIVPAGGGAYLAGGLADGPGSHSADGDPTKLAADGWAARLVR